MKKKTSTKQESSNGIKRNVSSNEAIPLENKKESEVALIKCPECFELTDISELETFGGMCEECSGAFD